MRDTQGWNQYKIEKKLKKNVQGEQGVQEGRVQEPPPPPPLQFRYPHCVPILVPMVLGRFHNLWMLREGRTNVTILVSADRQSLASGKRLL